MPIVHDLFVPISRDERQAQALRAWIKAKGHGTIVGCTGFGFIKCGKPFQLRNLWNYHRAKSVEAL